jgi:hypothetical protein
MAVCKRCGCAMPLGQKSCDLCATTDAVAPAQGPQAWQPPKDVAPASELASGAASWASGTARPSGSAGLVGSTEAVRARKRAAAAWKAAAFVGGVSLGLTIIAELANIASEYIGWGTGIEGAIYLVLAYFIRQRSRVALGIAIGLYALDGIALLASGLFVGLPIRIVFLLIFVRGFSALNTLRRLDSGQAAGQQQAA